MTSRAGGSSPHGAVMIRTSWPRSRRRSYVSRMCAFAPPGRGYAYGETMPIFNGEATRRSSFLFPGAPPRAFHGIAHHRAPLLTRDPVKALPERPVSSVRSGGAIRDRAAKCRTVVAVEIGPRRADELRVVRVARPGFRDVQHRRVEPGRARTTHSTCVRGIARLDAVDVDERIRRRRERTQRALAHREREIGEGMRHDRDAAGKGDARHGGGEGGEHRDLFFDP